MKIPYVINILKDKVKIEKNQLHYWNLRLLSTDPDTVRKANGNIANCESRIDQLETALKYLSETDS